MKKVLLSIIILLAITASSMAQSSSFLVRSGYSWVNGIVGGEYQISRIGVGLGWMPNQKPKSTERVTSICYNITFYGGNWDKSTFYITAAGATNRFQIEKYGSNSPNGDYYYESATGFMLTAGYKFAWDGADFKVGGGWGWGLDQSVGTLEATLGIRLMKNK